MNEDLVISSGKAISLKDAEILAQSNHEGPISIAGIAKATVDGKQQHVVVYKVAKTPFTEGREGHYQKPINEELYLALSNLFHDFASELFG